MTLFCSLDWCFVVFVLLSGGQIRATVMTAVAMQLNNGTIVTVMTNLFGQRERMLVYVNSTLLNFTSPSSWWQQYPGTVLTQLN